MTPSTLIKTLTATTLIGLAACAKTEAPEDKKLDITNDQLAVILGIDEAEALEFGDITSNAEGVEIDSLSVKTDAGRTLNFDDLDVDISAGDDQVYSISSITMNAMEGHDANQNMHVKISGLNVTRPDDNFITGLQNMVKQINNNQQFATKDLNFENLAIDTITVSSEDNDGAPHTITMGNLAIENAQADVFETLSVENAASETNNFKLEKLKFNNLDRDVVDNLLAQYLSTNAPDDINALDIDNSIPFDYMSVEHISSDDYMMGPLSVDISRTDGGQLSGVKIPASKIAFRADDNPLPDALKSASETPNGFITAQFALDYTTSPEQGDVIKAANLDIENIGQLNFSGNLKGLTPSVENSLQSDTIEADQIYAKAFTLSYTDNGFISELLDEEPKYTFMAMLILPFILEDRDEIGIQATSDKIKAFLKNPGTVSLEMESDTYHPIDGILEAITEPTDAYTVKLGLEPKASTPPE